MSTSIHTAAPWTRRLLEVLADGRWHHRDDLLDVAVTEVPAERASRSDGAEEIARHALDAVIRRPGVEQRAGHIRINKKTTKQGATRT